MPDLFGPIAGIASGLITGAAGLIQKGKARKALRNLEYPTEQLPDELARNQNSAEQLAAQGLPSEQYNQAMKNIQRQQLMSLRGAQDRRGGLMAISGIQQGTNDALLNLDARNAAQRIANKQQLMTVNNQVAGAKRDSFDKNVRDKYNRDYNYQMSVLGAGNQNLFGGIDKGAAGLGGLLSGLFGGKNSSAGADGIGGY